MLYNLVKLFLTCSMLQMYYAILLRLVPNDFTQQGETISRESIKGYFLNLSPTEDVHCYFTLL